MRFLKQYTEGESHEIIKKFHSGEELEIAFKTLDSRYGKADMIVRESLRNIRSIQPVHSEYNVSANKKLINQLTTHISTLKCWGFDFDIEAENSTFLTELEQKLLFRSYIKWEEERDRIRSTKGKIKVEDFMEFLNLKVQQEEKAQYLRNTKETNENKVNTKRQERATVLYNKAKLVKSNSENKAVRFGNTGTIKPKQNISNYPGKSFNKFQRIKKDNHMPQHKFCIFCETNTHSTAFCNVKKYTYKYKEDKCKKHNACFMCFKTGNHTSQTCPQKATCRICKRTHHWNLHTKEEIYNYKKKLPEYPKVQ